MNPFAVMFLLRLISRYLRASGDPGCEKAGSQIESDLNAIWEWVDQAFGYMWIGCLGLMVLFAILLVLGRGCELLTGRP